MNERIKELYEQATSYMPGRPPYDGLTFDVFDKEKFAELIVRECVQTLIDNTPERYASEDDWDRGYGRAMEDCVHHIQEHFGVEE